MHQVKQYEKVQYFQPPTPINDQKEYHDISIQHDPLEFDDQYQQDKKKTAIRNWGRCIVYLSNKSWEPLIVLGPHWPLFFCAFSVFLILSIVVITFILSNSQSTVIKILTILVCSIQLLSYLLVALKNPGVANQEIKELNVNEHDKRKPGEPWYCSICKLAQYPHTVHCEDCQVCIMELDHHCPWTGKCIGKGNIVEFYAFLGCTLIFMVYNIVVSMTQITPK